MSGFGSNYGHIYGNDESTANEPVVPSGEVKDATGEAICVAETAAVRNVVVNRAGEAIAVCETAATGVGSIYFDWQKWRRSRRRRGFVYS